MDNFKILHTDGTNAQPDMLTYEFFLRGCNRLLPKGETQTKLVKKAFDLCSKHGLVTPAVYREAAKADVQMLLRKLDTTEESKAEGSAFIPQELSHKVHRKQQIRKVYLSETFHD